MFFFGGGKCLNLGVVNVRILGDVNVLLANDSQSDEGPLYFVFALVCISILIKVTICICICNCIAFQQS